MLKKYPSRKTKIRRLTNQLLESVTDICFELDRNDTNFNYLLDHCDNLKDIIYDLKGLCYRRNYGDQQEQTEERN